MKLLYRLFRQDPDTRDGVITVTSGLGVVTNLLIAIVKIVIGALSASVAIVSEGVNNGADAITSILTLVGAKLAKKHPTQKHPFGFGRIEYLAGLVVAVLIMVTGTELLIESVKAVIHPEPLNVSYLSLIIVAASAIVKFFLGMYMIRMGKKTDSGALVGVGTENRNDSFASVITIVSAGIFLLFKVSVDAYAGILISLMLLKTGFDVLKDTVGDILGRPGDEELASTLYKEIRGTKGVIAAADMMLHNYGPDAWSGSVNVEIDHAKTVGEVYAVLHELQLRIMHQYHVTMVFGVYAVDNDRPDMKQLRQKISEFVKATEHVVSMHAVYADVAHNTLYCDLVVDYGLKDWEQLRQSFTAYMAQLYPDTKIELTIETEFV